MSFRSLNLVTANLTHLFVNLKYLSGDSNLIIMFYIALISPKNVVCVLPKLYQQNFYHPLVCLCYYIFKTNIQELSLLPCSFAFSATTVFDVRSLSSVLYLIFLFFLIVELVESTLILEQ